MKIKEQMEDAHKRQQKVIAQMRELESQKQALLQEALRIDGEIRLLKRMDGDNSDAIKAL